MDVNHVVSRSEGDPIHVAVDYASRGGDPFVHIYFRDTGVSLRGWEAAALRAELARALAELPPHHRA